MLALPSIDAGRKVFLYLSIRVTIGPWYWSNLHVSTARIRARSVRVACDTPLGWPQPHAPARRWRGAPSPSAGQNLKRLLKKRGWGRRPYPAEAVCALFLAAFGWLTRTFVKSWSFSSPSTQLIQWSRRNVSHFIDELCECLFSTGCICSVTYLLRWLRSPP